MTEVLDANDSIPALIRKTVRAPSSHNTQPWFFRVSNKTIDVFADRRRALPVNDPHDRELTISCGCALMNLRVAAAGAGFDVQINLLPDGNASDLLARVTIMPASSVNVPESVLLEFIDKRRTDRKSFASRDVDSVTVGHLLEASSIEGAWLRPLVTKEARQQAARLVALGDAVQWRNPSWRRELAVWMRRRRHGDGLIVPALFAMLARFIVRSFNMGDFVGAKNRQLAETSPLLAVLGTDGDTKHDWILAGQALQRLLLVGCQSGLHASYLNQPIQVAELRPKLQNLVGGGFPQILLRLGYSKEQPSASPRRPIEDVVERV